MLVTIMSNKVFQSESGKTILESALTSGVVLDYSCNSGQCGVCKTTLLDGDVKVLRPQLALTEQDKTERNILTCCCEPLTDIVIDAEDLTELAGIEIKTLPVRINNIERFGDNIVQVVVRLPPTANFKFIEGQHIDVIWNKIRRSYSIASTSGEKEITLLIKKTINGVMSDYWFYQAKPNDLLRIEGPKGTFFLRDMNKPLVMLATGTGIAPIMSILRRLDRTWDSKQQNSIYLFWGNRFSSEFVLHPEFRHIKVFVVKTITKPDSSWEGKVGYVQDVALDILGSEIVNCNVYACGSSEMIQSAKKILMRVGLVEKQFYSDAFVKSC